MDQLTPLVNSAKSDYSTNRRKRSQGIHRWSRRSKLLLVSVGLLSTIIFFLVLFFGIRNYSLNMENDSLRVKLNRSERELEALKPELKQLREDLKALVENRIPRLRSLEYDKVIHLDTNYVKNMVFTITKNGKQTFYEYKLVMENNTPFIIWPDLKIYFFDELGIQVGVEEIASSENVKAMEGDYSLEPGEARSFSSKISLTEDEIPAYFLVRVRGDDSLVDLRFEDNNQ